MPVNVLRGFPIVVWLCCGSLAQAATPMPGFPVQLDGVVDMAPPLAVDLNGDGRPELVVASRNQIHVIEADGHPADHFPFNLPKGSSISTALAAGDLLSNSGKRTEEAGKHRAAEKEPATPASKRALVFGTKDAKLWAVDASGQVMPGFPVDLTGPIAVAPSLGDWDGDGKPDILFGTGDGRLWALDGAGKSLAGFPATVGAPVSTAITRGRFSPSDGWLLLFGDERGNLHAWRKPSAELPGFPYRAKYTIAAQPVMGDVDGDGLFEVICGSKDYKLHVVESDGTAAAGFPVTTGYRVYAAAALADLDGDEVSDIAIASGDGRLYALRQGGQGIAGFPVQLGNRLRSSAVMGDADLDGQHEIALGSDRNQLHLLRSSGKNYPGYPVRMPDRIDVAPLLVDLNGDGSLELVAVSRNGSLHAFRLLKKGRHGKPDGWPSAARDATRSGVTHPNPPCYADLAIEPGQPNTNDTLKLGYRFFDLDGDPEPETHIQWLRDGKRVGQLDGHREVPPEMTRKHQNWLFRLQAGEGQRVFESPAATVGNTPPGAPEVTIQPDPARTGDEIRLAILKPGHDADGDRVAYQTRWLKDKKPQNDLKGERIAARLTAKGQCWTALVTPSDGEQAGPVARASRTVDNTPPSAAQIALEPQRPTADQPIRVKIVRPAEDPDGDPVSYFYHWQIGDRELNVAEDTAVLPAGFARKHELVRVHAVSFDGQERGGEASAEATVQNAPPAQPVVQILPEHPGTLDDLHLGLVGVASDADLDPVTCRASWLLDGRVQAEGLHLPASATRKGQSWTVRVTPFDGEAAGPVAEARVAIGNSPPAPGRVVAIDSRPTTTVDLQLRQESPPVDPDGDATWTDVVWLSDEREIARGQNLWSLPAADTKKHGRYLARLTPHDGSQTGKAMEIGFEVQNSPPGICRVAIQPASPSTGQELVAEMIQASRDMDGDPVTLRYRWYVDGQPLDPGKDGSRLDPARVRSGRRYDVVATPFDGESLGPACTASVLVQNSPPVPPSIRPQPEVARAGDAVQLVLTRPASDLDGDPLETATTWTLDGQVMIQSGGLAGIPAGLLRKGQQWLASVTVRDGQASAPPVQVRLQVANSAPRAPVLAIRPPRPTSSDDLGCRLRQAPRDADGDRLTLNYAWFLLKTGQTGPDAGQPPDHTGPTLPADRTRRGQRWLCEARGSDGTETGPAGSVVVDVANAAPSRPTVRLEPEKPEDDQELICRVVEPGVDPDGDPIQYRFRWTRDGLAQPFAGQTDRVPPRLTKPDDIWQCEVMATDGDLSGPVTQSREVWIGK